MTYWLRAGAVAGGAVIVTILAFAYLGLVAGILVLPVAAILVVAAMVFGDPARMGRARARSHEERAVIFRRSHRRAKAAEELERAAATLEAYVDDGSADQEIARLRAQAALDRAPDERK